MLSKNSLFVSAIRYYNQLKIDYRQFSNGNITKTEQTSFLINNNSMSQDAIFKLNVLEQNEPKTYISTICDAKEQKIISKSSKIKTNDITTTLNSKFNITVDKSTLFETKYFFNSSGIDYIYSPFHILNLYCEQNPSSNTLNGFILNNYLYIVILDDKSQIAYSKIEKLTSFDEIKKTNFYEDDLSGQKLFDEIYYFEIESIIGSILKEFYSLQDKIFINKINILHLIKQLNDEQIQKLHEELLLDINYESISLDDYLFELAKQNSKNQLSFIKPRKKKSSKFLFFTFITLSLLITASGFYIYNHIIVQKEKTQKEIIEEIELKKIEEAKPKLPNHIQKNQKFVEEIKRVFNTIPDSAVLNQFELNNNSLVLNVSLLESDTYIKDIQPKLSNLYETSAIIFDETEEKAPIKATITNHTPIVVQKESKVEKLPSYKNDSFLPKLQFETKLSPILGNNAKTKFMLSEPKENIVTFTYNITTSIKEPKELFELIEKFNKEPYSINISYPIKMEKIDKNIKTNFDLEFHQIN